ncbi:MAG: magnesium chelatase [Candidatus Yanofskybacteria bacterium CG10_big_fil_rev_8_21_14_0_10_36_16]|uniref:Magnesium chelatase n=1 Tax=Candidatus Yanofskybacteria bacterium CG10_big_fil_rev_8_21_14_0_10_36_16 TaxID=1975096 RepID=A0A2J0Q7W5_9BACT|nr:MAG: magnesium chelatase [Candidatus Yanofskybacteria bacterium CG10_big_fil_rev_8_21_14_0_10_36_16]
MNNSKKTKPKPTSVRIFSAAVVGLNAFPVEVEADASPGLHSFNIVGLTDKAVDESKDRIGSAIKNSGFTPPIKKNRRIVINLAPADIKKGGSLYDLPIALGYLLATSQIKFDASETVFLGELSLDGSVKKINGVLPIVQMVVKNGFKRVVLPTENSNEASLVSGIDVISIKNISEAVGYLHGEINLIPHENIKYNDFIGNNDDAEDFIDISQIKGQESAKRALVISAAGNHNILMSGPPGGGKTLLSKALSGILPAMDYDEALEITKIYSVAGMLSANSPIVTTRPFRSPHHTTSSVAVIGGGTSPRPGEITLAHRGVLFLDEVPEFPRSVLESLRQPLENGVVVVSRASGTAKFPARFLLVAAMNPCPCGNFGDDKLVCVCNANSINKYHKKMSGPLLDRIDIQINVSRETYDKMTGPSTGQNSTEIRQIVEKARTIQKARFLGSKTLTNSEMGIKEIETHCKLPKDAEELIKSAFVTHNISGRGYHKILKIARTIADLDESNQIQVPHIAEAIGYRIVKNEL